MNNLPSGPALLCPLAASLAASQPFESAEALLSGAQNGGAPHFLADRPGVMPVGDTYVGRPGSFR